MSELTLKAEFEASAEDVDSIFVSFRSLHEAYSQSFTALREQLNELPAAYANRIKNAERVFVNMTKTVSHKQDSISSQLYSQAIVLLMGNAEAILETAFKTLVVTNFRKIKTEDSKLTNFSLQEVLNNKSDSALGLLLYKKLESNKNPSEKLSFQNMQQLEKIFRSNLGIEIDQNIIVQLHEFWQIRHIVIHKQGYIDQQFIDNLQAAGINTAKYELNKQINPSRSDYKNCFGLLVLMFDEIDREINRLELDYSVPF